MSSKKRELSFGERIKAWRERAALTQAELDAAIGKTRGYTSQLEGGHIKKPPDRDTCEQIARAVGVPKLEVWRHAARDRLREFDPELLAFHEDELARGATDSRPALSEGERDLLDACRQFGRNAPALTVALTRMLNADRHGHWDPKSVEAIATLIIELDTTSIVGALSVFRAAVEGFSRRD